MESPSSYSSPTPRSQNEDVSDCEDHLHVCVLKATLEEVETVNSSCCHFRPYVVLEMDHPAQRYRTTMVKKQTGNRNVDFTWPESSFNL